MTFEAVRSKNGQQISGKFSHRIANLLLLATWIVGSLALMRSGFPEWRVVVGGAFILAGLCFCASYWVAPVSTPVTSDQGVAYIHVNASRYQGTDIVMFYIMNDTDKPVKELQMTIKDQGAASRYLKRMKTGKSPTEQGMEAVEKPISVGPLPTILAHTATEIRQFRKDISGRDSWSFFVHIQTDNHLFHETIRLKKLPDGGMTLSEILTLRDPKKGDVVIWEHTNANFPKDFAVE